MVHNFKIWSMGPYRGIGRYQNEYGRPFTNCVIILMSLPSLDHIKNIQTQCSITISNTLWLRSRFSYKNQHISTSESTNPDLSSRIRPHAYPRSKYNWTPPIKYPLFQSVNLFFVSFRQGFLPNTWFPASFFLLQYFQLIKDAGRRSKVVFDWLHIISWVWEFFWAQ